MNDDTLKEILRVAIGLVILVTGGSMFTAGAVASSALYDAYLPLIVVAMIVGAYLIYYALNILSSFLKQFRENSP